MEIDITPSPLRRLECVQRGPLQTRQAVALIAGLPGEIEWREIEAARKLLGWPEETFRIETLAEDRGPSNVLLLEAAFENVVEVVTGFGKLGVSAESLAKTAASRMSGYLASNAFVGPCLADQLILLFAVAGGVCSQRSGRPGTPKPP